MVDQAIHEHGAAQAAEDHRLTGKAANAKTKVRKILDTTGRRESRMRELSWLAWHTAALGRCKRQPKLERLLGRPKAALQPLRGRLLDALRGHNVGKGAG